jgi:hypothetical protein
MTEPAADGKEWNVLSHVPSNSEAEIIRATPGFAGIPAIVGGDTGLERALGLAGYGAPTSAMIHVAVPAERLLEARQVIADVREAAARPDAEPGPEEIGESKP